MCRVWPNEINGTLPNGLGDDVDGRQLHVFVARSHAVYGARKAVGTLNEAESMCPLSQFTPTGKFSPVPDKLVDGYSQIFA